MLLKKAKEIAGNLGNVSKMPCLSYGLPAGRALWVPEYCDFLGLPVPLIYGCTLGGIFSTLKSRNTVCSVCYADNRNNYTYESVKIGQVKRLCGVYKKDWVDAMVVLINHYSKIPYFRWHDSGDLLGVWHLIKIIEIAKKIPKIKFWLPTQEHKIIRKLEKYPSNLIIRESAIYIDRPLIKSRFPTSAVSSSPDNFTCNAPNQKHQCLECRDCWDKEVESVIYQYE